MDYGGSVRHRLQIEAELEPHRDDDPQVLKVTKQSFCNNRNNRTAY